MTLAERGSALAALAEYAREALAATRAHPAGLTRRERQVLDLICAGYTNGEIAGRLFIAVKTVDHHVSAVLGKLGVPTRAEAAQQAVRLGLPGGR